MNSVNWQEIRNLLAAIDQSDVVEFSLESQDFTITVRKSETGTVTTTTALPALPAPATTPTAVATPQVVATPVVAATPPAESTAASPPKDHWVAVTAPMVGTFYSAPAPGEDPFTNVGERVTAGQSVCIIEAMKLMNEIEAEKAGTVVEIVVQNAEPVEFGQTLMYIDPS